MITRLALWLFWACRHRWEVLREAPITLTLTPGGTSEGTRFYLRCTKCGDVRKKDLV